MSHYALETLFLIVLGVFFASGVLGFVMLLYLGRNHVKAVDRAVLGYELSTDIVSLSLRIPGYAGGFAWRSYARWSGLSGKFEHFDKSFKRPFIIMFWLIIVGACALAAGVFAGKILGRM